MMKFSRNMGSISFPFYQVKFWKSLSKAMQIKSFLLDLDTKEFWFYEGSLTTPPYLESVRYVIFRSSIPISTRQVNNQLL